MGVVEIFLTYKDLNTVLHFSEYDTIRDVKSRVELTWEVPVQQQYLIGFVNNVCDDNVILKNCVVDDFCCIEVVDSIIEPCGNSTSEMDHQSLEIESIRSFQSKISTILPLEVNSVNLVHAAFNISNSSTKKVLLIYLYHSADSFSHEFLHCLKNTEIITLLNKHFYFIGWDIENPLYHQALISAFETHNELSNLTYLIRNGTAAVLCLFLEDKDIHIFNILKEDCSSNVIHDKLRMVADTLCPQSLDMELEAIQSLRKKLPQDISYLLDIRKLKDIIEFITTGPLNERKGLILYLHNSNQPFGKLFPIEIAKEPLNSILTRSFMLIGWDVEEDIYIDALLKTISDYIDLTMVSNLVTSKTSIALVIVPVGGTIVLATVCRGKMTAKELADSFSATEAFLISEIENEKTLLETNQSTIDADQMQCIFADRLGDRDYDRFDCDELEHLNGKIGFALYGPPKDESGYGEKEKEHIQSITDVVKRESALIAEHKDVVEIAVIYNCTTLLPEDRIKLKRDKPNVTDVAPVAVFIVRKCRDCENPCRVFIDTSGRVYETWTDYITRNKLNKCLMVLPLNGRYQVENGKILLEKHLSPACQIDAKLLQVGDIAGTAVGLVSGGILIAAAIPAVTVAPVFLVGAAITGAVGGVWAIGRSIHNLWDRNKHNESMSLANAEARGSYLNILAGSLGFVGAGASVAMTQMATRGIVIGKGAQNAFNALSVVNLTTSGASIVNSGVDVIYTWYKDNETPSALTIIQLSSSILFFGHALYNFKGAQAIIEETHTKVLSDYNDSLRSNRHRKTFNKLMKDTQRVHGDTSRANAEVISAIRKIPNKDEVFASLTRHNKEMNKRGIKFNVDEGAIKFNGFTVDFNEFIALSKKDASAFLGKISDSNPTSLPTASSSSPVNSSFTNTVNNMLPKFGINNSQLNVIQIASNLYKLIEYLKEDTQIKMLNLISEGVYRVLKTFTAPMLKELEMILPSAARFGKFFEMGISYFSREVDYLEQRYQSYKRTGNEVYHSPIFDYVDMSSAKRVMQFLDYAVQSCYDSRGMVDRALRGIANYVAGCIAKLFEEEDERRDRTARRLEHSANYRPKRINCAICGGHYFKAS